MHFETDPVKSPIPELRGISGHRDEQPKSGYLNLGEFLITVMSSLSQEESRSISENVRWGMRKKMQDGKYSVVYSHFLGYDRGPDGGMVINHNEAKILFIQYRRLCRLRRICIRSGYVEG